MTVSMVGKLVRDKIPKIMIAKGVEPVFYIAGPEERRRRLRRKLMEEVREYLVADEESGPEELADVLEVILAFARDHGLSRDQLEEIRMKKELERGGFDDWIILTGTR
ncbi:nucleoside triphosphate pyrophosphohydrolase [Streptomyces sp. NPDC093249]|uniref:nucleoside triphosphate pyrophosphohydrolase n=1 Tax=unclassified Streptomyces TaxID=2593676 RepID=UPI00344F6794